MVNGPLDYFRRIEGYLWRLVDGGPVILPDGGGHPLRHVDGGEVARFLCGMLGRKETFGCAFNVAQEEAPTLAELVESLRQLVGSCAEIVAVPADRIRAAGLRLIDVSPFDDRWMSYLDPGLAREELGFRHAPLAQSLAAIASSFLAHTPSDRPPGYARRDAERRLLASTSVSAARRPVESDRDLSRWLAAANAPALQCRLVQYDDDLSRIDSCTGLQVSGDGREKPLLRLSRASWEDRCLNQRKPGTVARLEVLGGVLVQNLVPIAPGDPERIDECRMNAVE